MTYLTSARGSGAVSAWSVLILPHPISPVPNVQSITAGQGTGLGQPGVSKLCPGKGTGVAWIIGQVLEHKSVPFLRDHNLTLPRDTRDCKGASENVASTGNTGTFVASRAGSVLLFWLVAVIQDAVIPLVISFIVNDSSFCCEKHG